tara:strand:- start:165 stop:350 length:186 start_codon:yes stop_codon:yes gene_type:complete
LHKLITYDNRPVKIQQEEHFQTCKDWEIRKNVFLNPYDKTEFMMQDHIYKLFLKWKKEKGK